MTSCPKSEPALPESFSTGTTRPSDVADSVMAISKGDWMRPPARSRSPMANPRAREMANPIAGRRSLGPRRWPSSTSKPETNNRNPSPTTARTLITRSAWTQPSTDGPRRIPNTISTTTAGNLNLGNRPRTNGAAKATAETTTIPEKETSGIDQSPMSTARAGPPSPSTTLSGTHTSV